MSDKDKPSGNENRRPPSGAVSSPRAYFGRASRAVTGGLRAGITEVSGPGPAAAPRRPPVYRAGDPALRLFADFALSLPSTAPLTGATATLSGIRDGEHEKLFIDLGTSLVRSTPRRDEKAGTLSLILSRMQSGETYGTLLASLRYVNDAPAPTHGARRITLQTIDARGATNEVGSAQFGVGEAPLEPVAELETTDERIVIGEKVCFNTDGGYTLFWWPNLLPGAVERAAEAGRRMRAGAAQPDPAASTGSYFSAGGKLYRIFDAAADRAAAPRAAAPEPAAAPAHLAANDSVAPPPRAASDAVWVPGRGVPPPGFERARMLRLEDIFGSDMQDAIARRLIEHRIAAGG
ncbi:MAG TPA: hypothetical protein VIF14_08835 [Alphaproteobacteria bacterium]